MYDPGAGAGEAADEVYRERVRALVKQPTAMASMRDQTEYEYADELPFRGENWTDVVSCLSFPALRLGFLIQALTLLLAQCIYRGHGGRNAFTFDLYNFAETLRSSQSFTLLMCLLMAAHTFGTLLLLGFQAFVADNGKFSRGFRAGSKLLQTGLTLDLLVIGLRLLQFIYGYHFLQTRWWLHYTQTKTDYVLFYAGAVLHAIALIHYGLGIFYMEAYHDEGTYEEFAWSLLTLFGLAGLFELLMVFTGVCAFFSVVQTIALFVAVIWAFSFEPLLHFHQSALHDRCINDESLNFHGAKNPYETTGMMV